jgi:hypothetical protein
MLQRVLLILFFVIVIVLVVAWIAGGAGKQILSKSGQFVNPFGVLLGGQIATGTSFLYFPPPKMPGIPLPSSLDEAALGGTGSSISAGSSEADTLYGIEDRYSDLDQEYADLAKKVNEAKTFGEISPFKGAISISNASAPRESDPHQEYLQLTSPYGNSKNVSLSGWSLQSAITGVRAYLPRGSVALRVGEVAPLSDVILGSGESIYVTSGTSPVGTSFRENVCSGYLTQFQEFAPDLSRSCPAPDTELVPTPDNLARYGESCFELLASMPSCTYFIGELPTSVSPACASFVRQAISYNGCVEQHRWRADFTDGTWRLYLGSERGLWQDRHDVLRLLDAQGRTVSVWSY